MSHVITQYYGPESITIIKKIIDVIKGSDYNIIIKNVTIEKEEILKSI